MNVVSMWPISEGWNELTMSCSYLTAASIGGFNLQISNYNYSYSVINANPWKYNGVPFSPNFLIRSSECRNFIFYLVEKCKGVFSNFTKIYGFWGNFPIWKFDIILSET